MTEIKTHWLQRLGPETKFPESHREKTDPGTRVSNFSGIPAPRHEYDSSLGCKEEDLSRPRGRKGRSHSSVRPGVSRRGDRVGGVRPGVLVTHPWESVSSPVAPQEPSPHYQLYFFSSIHVYAKGKCTFVPAGTRLTSTSASSSPPLVPEGE